MLALLAARSPLLEAIIDPFVEVLRPISAIAWIPIAILMFGIGRGVPVFLIFYAASFPIFINTLGRHQGRRPASRPGRRNAGRLAAPDRDPRGDASRAATRSGRRAA